MLSQLNARERAIYGVIVAALLCGFGYFGSRQLQSKPELKLEPLVPATAGMEEPARQEVLVHVAGAVKRPGVVRMAADARVQDAIQTSGGAKPTAALDELNLAAKLVDGTQLFVPGKGQAAEVAEAYRGGGSEAYRAKPKASSGGGTPGTGSISLNSAGASQLDRLPGVGPATAAKILEYRRAHGGFSSIDELLSVKGIGPKKLAAMRKFVRL